MEGTPGTARGGGGGCVSQNPDDRKCRPRRTGRAPPRAQGARRPSAPGGSAGRARGRCLGLQGLKLPKGASRVRDAAGPQRPASWALRKGNVPFGIGQKTARVSREETRFSSAGTCGARRQRSNRRRMRGKEAHVKGSAQQEGPSAAASTLLPASTGSGGPASLRGADDRPGPGQRAGAAGRRAGDGRRGRGGDGQRVATKCFPPPAGVRESRLLMRRRHAGHGTRGAVSPARSRPAVGTPGGETAP